MFPRIFVDQMNQKIVLEAIPKRIVSLVPSQTELLFDLGLGDRVVGITKFCIHPKDWYDKKVKVGGTKNLNTSKIRGLAPDLIIGNKEENTKEQIEELKQLAPVWMSDIDTMDDALEMILSVGALTGTDELAGELVQKIRSGFKQFSDSKISKEVVYLIWNKPMMAAAKDTFINELIELIGLKNTLVDATRYPEWFPDMKQLPDYIFLSTEPYPFKATDVADFQNRFPDCKVLLVDGEFFSWYGSRLLKSVTYFKDLINNQLS